MNRHNIIYNKDNNLFVFGSNFYGQLGLGHNNNINIPILLMQDQQIKSISCGYNHSIIQKTNGELLIFGNNAYGQLGLEHNQNINIPTLLTKNIKIIQNTKITKWRPEDHYRCMDSFKQQIYNFLLCHKRLYYQTIYRVPKPILYIIIKYIYKNWI